MTFDTAIQHCEHCNQKYIVNTMMSYNTFGATLWTDGECVNHGYIKPIKVFKCNTCFKINWVKTQPERTNICNINFDNIKPMPYPSKELYEEIILNKLYTNIDDEIYIRLEYWHLCNNKNKSDKFMLDKNNSCLIDNLYCLLKIFERDEENLDYQLLRCEILRELELFENAMQVLVKIDNMNIPNEVITLFENLINKKDARIQQVIY